VQFHVACCIKGICISKGVYSETWTHLRFCAYMYHTQSSLSALPGAGGARRLWCRVTQSPALQLICTGELCIMCDMTHLLVSHTATHCNTLQLMCTVDLCEGTGTRPDYLVNRADNTIEGSLGQNIVRKSRNSCTVSGGGVGAKGTKGVNWRQSWKQIQTLKECLCCHIYCARLGTPWHRTVAACRAVLIGSPGTLVCVSCAT